MKSFEDKVAVITGAGSGIGQSLAVQLDQDGSHLALGDINTDHLEETPQLLTLGTKVSCHNVDVSNPSRMSQFASDVIAAHGHVDILINNAGITLTPTLFEDIPAQQFKKVIDVNMWGVYYGTREFLPYLRRRPEAVIINISSLAGLVGLFGYSPYAMSKFAVRGLTESLQSELVGTNVSILIVQPGGVKTNLIKNVPDLTDAQAREDSHQEFTRAAGITPEKAAEKILKAVKKNRRSLIIGTDAKVVNAIRDLFPNSFPRILHSAFSRMTFK